MGRSVWQGQFPGFDMVLQLCEGEGNGNPLQYYCLENPMGGAW